MYGLVIQDWITIRGSNTSALIQDESAWVDLSPYQDIVLFLDVRELTTPGGSITMAYETAPIKDSGLGPGVTGLFQAMASEVLSAPAPSPPVPKIKTVILSTNPAVPLSTWVRWNLTSSVAQVWDITFRLLATVNRVTSMSVSAGMPGARAIGRTNPFG